MKPDRSVWPLLKEQVTGILSKSIDIVSRFFPPTLRTTHKGQESPLWLKGRRSDSREKWLTGVFLSRVVVKGKPRRHNSGLPWTNTVERGSWWVRYQSLLYPSSPSVSTPTRSCTPHITISGNLVQDLRPSVYSLWPGFLGLWQTILLNFSSQVQGPTSRLFLHRSLFSLVSLH